MILREPQLVELVTVSLRLVEEGVSLPAVPSARLVLLSDHVRRRHQAQRTPHAVGEIQAELSPLGQQAELCKLVSGQPAAPVMGEVCFGGAAGDCEGWSV